MRNKRLKLQSLAVLFVITGVLAIPKNSLAGKTIVVPSGKITTISIAMTKAAPGDTVWVNEGVYRGNFFVNNGVVLKARSLHKVILDGGKRGTVVTLGRNSAVSGFIIRNGTIGVFSSSFENVISHCLIVNNFLSGIICVRNLPKIEDNIIAYNGGSGIQTWDVNATSGTINHNTIAFNGNNGIAAGGESNLIIENNIIAFNRRFGISRSKTTQRGIITSNNIYGNLIGADAPPAGNYSFNPEFAAPKTKFNFNVLSTERERHIGSDSEPLGARIVF